MKSVNLIIICKTLSDRAASIAVLSQGDYKKAIVKCEKNADFKSAFTDAIEKIKQKSVINVFTNRKSAEVQNLIMRENNAGKHFVFLQSGKPLETLEWLAYEIALQNGTDSAIMEDILKNG